MQRFGCAHRRPAYPGILRLRPTLPRAIPGRRPEIALAGCALPAAAGPPPAPPGLAVLRGRLAGRPGPPGWPGLARLTRTAAQPAGPTWAGLTQTWAASAPLTVIPARVRLRTRDLRAGSSVRAPWSLRRAGRRGERAFPVSPMSSSSSASSPARPRSARGRLPLTPAGMSRRLEQVLRGGVGLGWLRDAHAQGVVDQLPARHVAPVHERDGDAVPPARPVRPVRCR